MKTSKLDNLPNNGKEYLSWETGVYRIEVAHSEDNVVHTALAFVYPEDNSFIKGSTYEKPEYEAPYYIKAIKYLGWADNVDHYEDLLVELFPSKNVETLDELGNHNNWKDCLPDEIRDNWSNYSEETKKVIRMLGKELTLKEDELDSLQDDIRELWNIRTG